MRRRQHVNPLLTYFETFRGARPALRSAIEVEVEIGCADAQFLFERAQADAGRHYVGLEIRESLVREVNERAVSLGAPVQAVFCNANHHLESLFPPGSVDRVFLNFPDPWFKRRHRKRRMIDEPLVESISRVVSPGGDVFIQTDVWDIGLDAMDLFERHDLFENQVSPWSFFRADNPYRARSWRERHCLANGLPIWRMLYLSRVQRSR